MPTISPAYEGISGRVLLMEGMQDCYIPEVIYVKQGDKAHFFRGQISESLTLDEGSLSIVEKFEDLDLETITINEGQDNEQKTQHVKGGVWIVEGPYQRSDTKNANGRVYARGIWERLIADKNSVPMQNLLARGMVGQLEHPKDGRGDGREGALLHTDMQLRKDGVVWGVSELLDTPNGRILQEYTRKKIRWGVSSRGNGTVSDTGVVSETDFTLDNFDAVMKPSTPGAYPTPKVLKPYKEDTEVLVPEEVNEQSDVHPVKEVAFTLVQTDLSRLDEASLAGLVGDIMATLGKVEQLKVDSRINTDTATELNSWLTKKLREAHERSPLVPAMDVINQAVRIALNERDDETENDQTDAYESAVMSMQGEVKDLATEVATLREDNDELMVEVARLQAECDRERDSADQFMCLAEEGCDDIAQVQAELDEAVTLLSEGSASKEKQVENVVDLFEGEESSDEIIEPGYNSSLPRGISVISESVAGNVVKSGDRNRGAIMAAKICAKMNV